MIKTIFIVLLILIILIYIPKSKHTAIIIKNNIKAFLIQSFIPLLSLIIIMLLQNDSYNNSFSIPSYEFYGYTEKASYYEFYISIIAMFLHVILGMLLTVQKSKLKNFFSVFINYLLILILHLVFPLIKDTYIWLPFKFIHPYAKESTQLIHNYIFFIILFIPTFFIWIGLELKRLFIKKFFI